MLHIDQYLHFNAGIPRKSQIVECSPRLYGLRMLRANEGILVLAMIAVRGLGVAKNPKSYLRAVLQKINIHQVTFTM